MKRTGLIAALVTALVVLTGASVWEGAAAVAPAGDLPDAGYYAATNSFPRNTVVDITNLETGKSIRVIVSSGLETPGLLALISRDTASVIGMPLRSIGRIRMIQPSDPVAFSRFNEEMASSGDPDYDPGALVAAETARQTAEPAAGAEAARQTVEAARQTAEAARGAETAPPAETPAPQPSRAESTPPAAAGSAPPAGAPAEAAPVAALVPVPEERTAGEPPPGEGGEITDLPEPAGTDEGIVRETAPALAVVPGAGTEEAPAEAAAEVPDTAWYAGEETGGGVEIADEPGMRGTETPAPEGEAGSYVLVPGEDRPPAAAEYALPPEAEIEPLENRPPAAAEHTLPPEAEIEPLENRPPVEIAGAAEAVPDEALFIDPVSPEPAEHAEDAAEPAASPAPFSAPLIAGLESGKYYLQIGAYSRAETVESELSKIDRVYPVAVQNTGDPENPVYRILLGPVNLGESGALLQRFKGMGYGDAFVRAAR